MASLGVRLFHVKKAVFRPEALAQSELYSRCERCGSWKENGTQSTRGYWLGSPTVQPHETCLRIAGGDEERECLFRRMSEFFPLQLFSTSTPLPQISHCAINLEAWPHSFPTSSLILEAVLKASIHPSSSSYFTMNRYAACPLYSILSDVDRRSVIHTGTSTKV